MLDASMQPGVIVDQRFEVERLAAAGGMGQIFQARDRIAGGAVAIKILERSDRRNVERFEREARLLAELEHPSIVRYIGHGLAPSGAPYLALEWLEGEDLAARLERGRLDVEHSVAVAVQVARALGVAHARGIVHRDIKPANLFLVGGEIDRVKVLDFGVARLRDEKLTRTGVMIGTPAYMSPEQARGTREIDARADVFSLGCVLFECLTARRVFPGEELMGVLAKVLFEEAPRPSELCEGLAPSLDELVGRMLAKDPAARPPDGAAAAAALEALAVSQPAPASTPVRRPLPSLTTEERRLISVAVVQPDPTFALASTMTSDEDARTATALAPLGARVEALVDGSLVAVLEGVHMATDQAALAARCALMLHAQFPHRRIGVATGLAVLAGRLPLGEVIDRAVALVREGSGTPAVRIDELTARLLGTAFDLLPEGNRFVLGGERSVGEAGTLLGRPTPCVGRDAELASLEALLTQCIEEAAARAILVTGPAGTGKSRLRHELGRRLRMRGDPFDVWLARGTSARAGAAFGLIADLIHGAAGMQQGEPPEVRQQKLSARIATRLEGEEARRVSEFLGELVGASFPDTDRVELQAARRDPILLGDQIRRAWEDWLAAECAARPILLLVEDLHWGDVPSVRLIDAALRHLADRPLAVLALARPEVHELFPDLWTDRALHQMRLGELGRRASERLIRDVLGSSVPAEMVAKLVERAAGNAFFLEELIRAVAEGHGEALPNTVLAMAQSRLKRMDERARHLLRAASVFGRNFWRGGLAELLGTPATGSIGEQLAELIEREVITRRPQSRFPDEEEYAFRHELLREASYSMLTDDDRALGHRLVGEWLERAGEHQPLVLAEHFERGREQGRAVDWYHRAAERALAGNDFAGALQRADRAVECGATGETLGGLRLLQAEGHYWRGELTAAEARAIEASNALATGSAPWFQALTTLASAACPLGTLEQHEQLLRQATTTQPAAGAEAARLTALAGIACELQFGGLRSLATEMLVHIAELEGSEEARQPTVAGRIANARAIEAMCQGDPAEGADLFGAAAAHFAEAADLRGACMMSMNAGFGLSELGAYAEAERTLRPTLAMAERLGVPFVAASTRQNLALPLEGLGSLEEARALQEAALEALRAQGDRRMAGASRIALASILGASGDLEQAERHARMAVDELAQVLPMRAKALGMLARVLLLARRETEALEAAHQAMDQMTALGSLDEGEALIRLVYAEALHATGAGAAADLAIAAARDRLFARAQKIADPSRRAGFLERVPENARTMALARAWLV
jgi:tetratricopeptide (TPR) repeat protein